MTARTWKLYLMDRDFPSTDWKARLISGDDILIGITVDGRVSKMTAEEIVNQFVSKTAEDAAG